MTKPSGSNGVVEFVRVGIWLDHALPNSIGLRLTSPSNTTVNITQPYTNITVNPYNGASYRYFDIGVNAFYGETMEGTWTLSVDEYTDDGVNGVLADWGLQIYGN